MTEIRYCSRCCYPTNHPYNIILDDQGVCSGCRVHEEKDIIDWNERFNKLKQVLSQIITSGNKKTFDCIIPVTGGGDSYFIVHTVKNVLGLNPLLVHYNSHYNTKIGIRNLANLCTVFDCEMITSTLSPNLLKKITRETLKSYSSIYWHVMAGTTTFPVQVAVKFKIPLIIWGVHPWSDQSGMFSHTDEVEMTERCRIEHPMMGINPEDLIKNNNDIKTSDIQSFKYPSDFDIEHVGVRGIYLSNYFRWDSKKQHELMIKMYGYESKKMNRTFNTYEDVHCFHSADLHDYLKFIKLGYSKVYDHASREIRLKRMTREEGIKLILEYRDKPPKDLHVFLDWLEMSEKEFWSYVWNRRDSRMWTLNKKGEWKLTNTIENFYSKYKNKVKLDKTENCKFLITPSLEPRENENKYLLMGRGYIDKFNFGSLTDKPLDGAIYKRDWKFPKI